MIYYTKALHQFGCVRFDYSFIPPLPLKRKVSKQYYNLYLICIKRESIYACRYICMRQLLY